MDKKEKAAQKAADAIQAEIDKRIKEYESDLPDRLSELFDMDVDEVVDFNVDFNTSDESGRFRSGDKLYDYVITDDSATLSEVS